jgi:hypothetical protein
MEEIQSYVIYNEDLKALICRSCQYGLNPKGVKRHFQLYHKGVTLQLRKRIIAWCDTQSAKRLEDVEILMREVDAIEGLKVIDGFICHTCESLWGTLPSMMKHCQVSHKWTTSKSNNS